MELYFLTRSFIKKTKLKLQSDELSLGEIIHDKKTIPNAVKKIEHIMKHSIPPPNDKALIIFSWSVLIQIQSYPYHP